MNYRSSQELEDQFTHYEEMLRRHDWTYEMSDDPSVYQKGAREADDLLKVRRSLRLHDAARVESLFMKYCLRGVSSADMPTPSGE